MSKFSLVSKVDALRGKMSVKDACKKAGISVPTYYSYKQGPKAKQLKAMAPKPPKAEKATSVAAPKLKVEDGSIIVIVIPPRNAKAMLQQLLGTL